MKELFVRSVRLMAAMTLLTGVAYPAAVTLAATLLAPQKAEGSLVVVDGVVVGSELLGQGFESPGYFHGRPSAVDYDASTSGGSNLGPTNAVLAEQIAARAASLGRATDGSGLPVDLLTASGSGLDPHISPRGAAMQVARVAAARRLDPAALKALVDAHVEPRTLGVLGERRVNVLRLNLALDALALGRPNTEVAP